MRRGGAEGASGREAKSRGHGVDARADALRGGGGDGLVGVGHEAHEEVVAVGDAERGDELLVESHRGGGLLQRGDEVGRRARVGGTSGGRRDARANARHDGNGRVHSRVPRRLEVVRGGHPHQTQRRGHRRGTRCVARAARWCLGRAQRARRDDTLSFPSEVPTPRSEGFFINSQPVPPATRSDGHAPVTWSPCPPSSSALGTSRAPPPPPYRRFSARPSPRPRRLIFRLARRPRGPRRSSSLRAHRR